MTSDESYDANDVDCLWKDEEGREIKTPCYLRVAHQHSEMLKELGLILEEMRQSREDLLQTLQGRTPTGYIPTKVAYLLVLFALGLAKADTIGQHLGLITKWLFGSMP